MLSQAPRPPSGWAGARSGSDSAVPLPSFRWTVATTEEVEELQEWPGGRSRWLARNVSAGDDGSQLLRGAMVQKLRRGLDLQALGLGADTTRAVRD